MPVDLYPRRNYPHRDEPDRLLHGIAGARPIANQLNDIGGHLIAVRAGVDVAGLPCF